MPEVTMKKPIIAVSAMVLIYALMIYSAWSRAHNQESQYAEPLAAFPQRNVAIVTGTNFVTNSSVQSASSSAQFTVGDMTNLFNKALLYGFSAGVTCGVMAERDTPNRYSLTQEALPSAVLWYKEKFGSDAPIWPIIRTLVIETNFPAGSLD